MTEEKQQQQRLITPNKRWSLYKYGQHVWNDHDSWIHIAALKAGATAVVTSVVIVMGMAATLPFATAAATIVGAGALVTAGIAGVSYGFQKTRESFSQIRKKIESERFSWIRKKNNLPEDHDLSFLKNKKPTAEKKPNKLVLFIAQQNKKLQKLRMNIWNKIESSAIWQATTKSYITKKITQSRIWGKLSKTMPWQLASRITQDKELVVRGFAVSGSAWTVIAGLSLLATEILALPVLTMGLAAVSVVSVVAISGYMGVKFAKDLSESIKNFKYTTSGKDTTSAELATKPQKTSENKNGFNAEKGQTTQAFNNPKPANQNKTAQASPQLKKPKTPTK